MSRTALFIALIVAICLGGVALLVLRGGGRSRSAGPSAAAEAVVLPPIAELVAFSPDGSGDVVRVEGRWLIDGWPADARRVATALDALGAALAAPPSADPVELGSDPARWELRYADGTTATLMIARSAVAGRVQAAINRDGLFQVGPIGAAVLHTLDDLPPTPAWRVRSLFPDLQAPSVNALVIDFGTDRIALSRLAGHWRVTHPFAARADHRVVASLLDRLMALEIERFTDASPVARPPDLSIVLTAGRGATRDERIATLWSAGASTEARVDGLHAASVSLAGDVPTSVSTAVRNYLAPTPSDLAPADISIVRLVYEDAREKGYRRDLGTWMTMPTPTPANGEMVDELIAFLTAEPQEPQESLAGDDLRSLVRIELHDYFGEPLQFLNAGYTADGVFAIRGANVVWVSGRWRGPTLLGLPAFAEIAPPPDRPEPDPARAVPPK